MAIASDEIYFTSPIENYPLYKCRSSKLDDTFLIKLPIESSSRYHWSVQRVPLSMNSSRLVEVYISSQS